MGWPLATDSPGRVARRRRSSATAAAGNTSTEEHARADQGGRVLRQHGPVLQTDPREGNEQRERRRSEEGQLDPLREGSADR